ncbi:MAG: DsbA family protein [Chloroflexota bacterium]
MTSETQRGEAARLTLPVGERDHAQGPTDAAVTLVEYGDFECPYCRAAVPIVDELRRRLGDQLLHVFRHFPVVKLHPHAQHAAEAAEAAGAQGKFFEMHGVLFEHQEALADDDLARYAAELDLDGDRFGRELRSHAHAGRVREDFRSGVAAGVRGTPTFYLDGLRYDGLVGVPQLMAAIRAGHPDLVDEESARAGTPRPIPRVVRQRTPYGPESA